MLFLTCEHDESVSLEGIYVRRGNDFVLVAAVTVKVSKLRRGRSRLSITAAPEVRISRLLADGTPARKKKVPL